MTFDEIDAIQDRGLLNTLIGKYCFNLKSIGPEVWRIMKKYLQQRHYIYEDYQGEWLEKPDGIVDYPPDYLSSYAIETLIDCAKEVSPDGVRILIDSMGNYWVYSNFDPSKSGKAFCCGKERSLNLALCKFLLKLHFRDSQ